MNNLPLLIGSLYGLQISFVVAPYIHMYTYTSICIVPQVDVFAPVVLEDALGGREGKEGWLGGAVEYSQKSASKHVYCINSLKRDIVFLMRICASSVHASYSFPTEPPMPYIAHSQKSRPQYIYQIKALHCIQYYTVLVRLGTASVKVRLGRLSDQVATAAMAANTTPAIITAGSTLRTPAAAVASNSVLMPICTVFCRQLHALVEERRESEREKEGGREGRREGKRESARARASETERQRAAPRVCCFRASIPCWRRVS